MKMAVGTGQNAYNIFIETLNYHHVDDISIILKRTRGDFAPLPFVILFE